MVVSRDKARSIKIWRREAGVEEVDCPALSPDLKSKEHLWDALEWRLWGRYHPTLSVWPNKCASRRHHKNPQKHTPKPSGQLPLKSWRHYSCKGMTVLIMGSHLSSYGSSDSRPNTFGNICVSWGHWLHHTSGVAYGANVSVAVMEVS